MRVLATALLLCTALAGAACSRAAEVEVTPAGAFAAAIADRAEPAEADAFAYEGELFMNTVKLGTFRFSAAVVAEDGRQLYQMVDLGRMSIGGQTFRAETKTWLDRRLASLRGEETKDDNGVKSFAKWQRTETGYTIFETLGEGEETEKAVAAPGGLLSNVSGVILFARALPAEAGTYAFRSLNALNQDREDVEEILLTALGEKEWNGAPALLFHRRHGTRDVTFALDPESRDLLGMKMEEEGGPSIEFRPGTSEEVALAADPFAPPAKDAKQCALIAALAYGTGNGELLSSICDWDSIVTDLRAKFPDKEFDRETLRAGVIDNLDNYAGAQPRATVAPVILAISGEVKVTEEGDRVTAVFPPAFNRLTILVGRFGDEWRVVALPGT